METMTPSTITDRQIDKAVDVYRSMLRKHRSELGAEEAQQVLGQDDFVGEMVGVLRKRVEAVSKMIVRHVLVNRSRSHREALDATGRKQYINPEVLATMPKGGVEEVDMYFFDLNYDPTVDELDREMEIRGLKPDPDALAAVNEADPAFTDERPNATQWRDANGKACYAIFDRRIDERSVDVYRYGRRWSRSSRFAGVRK